MKLIAILNWSQRYHGWAIKEHVFPSVLLTCSVWCLNIIWKFKKHALAKKLILTNDTKISNSFHFFWLCRICSLFQLKLSCYCYPLRRCFPADFPRLKILVFHQLFKTSSPLPHIKHEYTIIRTNCPQKDRRGFILSYHCCSFSKLLVHNVCFAVCGTIGTTWFVTKIFFYLCNKTKEDLFNARKHINP